MELINKYREFSNDENYQEFMDYITNFEGAYGPIDINILDKYYDCVHTLKTSRNIDRDMTLTQDNITKAINQKKEIILDYKEQKEQKDQLERLAVFSKGTNPVVDNLTNFNKMI